MAGASKPRQAKPRRWLSVEEEVETVQRLLRFLPAWRAHLSAIDPTGCEDLRIQTRQHPWGTIYTIQGSDYWACDLDGLVDRIKRQMAAAHAA